MLALAATLPIKSFIFGGSKGNFGDVKRVAVFIASATPFIVAYRASTTAGVVLLSAAKAGKPARDAAA